MKKQKEISTLDALLSLYFVLACPVVIISIFTWDFSYPILGYVVFFIAAYRVYHLFGKGKTNRSIIGNQRYYSGMDLETNVVGVTFENRQNIIKKITIGQKLFLIREPENTHDKNAIKVLVNRYTKDQQEEIQSELEDKYGKYSYDEIFRELYAKDSIGYISRELAEKLSPIFDLYAIKPNQYVPALVTDLVGGTSENQSRGVRIKFKIPTEEDLKRAFNDQMLSDMEMDMRRGPF